MLEHCASGNIWAAKRLHILRILCRCRLPPDDLFSIYIALVLPILEYNCTAWHTSIFHSSCGESQKDPEKGNQNGSSISFWFFNLKHLMWKHGDIAKITKQYHQSKSRMYCISLHKCTINWMLRHSLVRNTHTFVVEMLIYISTGKYTVWLYGQSIEL